MDREALPRKGLQKSAQGFNPGNPQNKRFALKVKGPSEMRVPDEACTVSALFGRSIWRPLQGASLLVDDSQG